MVITNHIYLPQSFTIYWYWDCNSYISKYYMNNGNSVISNGMSIGNNMVIIGSVNTGKYIVIMVIKLIS